MANYWNWISFVQSLFYMAKQFRKTPNEELGRSSVEAHRKAYKLPVTVVLDNVRSMHNVGATFRTADAFLVEKIILTGITARPPHREIHKTALGATETVEWEYIKDVTEFIKERKRKGFTIVSVEQAEPHVSLNEFIPSDSRKYCLVFGNEITGVSEQVIQLSDLCLEIPQSGTKHSLNISVSMGIVLWKFYELLVR